MKFKHFSLSWHINTKPYPNAIPNKKTNFKRISIVYKPPFWSPYFASKLPTVSLCFSFVLVRSVNMYLKIQSSSCLSLYDIQIMNVLKGSSSLSPCKLDYSCQLFSMFIHVFSFHMTPNWFRHWDTTRLTAKSKSKWNVKEICLQQPVYI